MVSTNRAASWHQAPCSGRSAPGFLRRQRLMSSWQYIRAAWLAPSDLFRTRSWVALGNISSWRLVWCATWAILRFKLSSSPRPRSLGFRRPRVPFWSSFSLWGTTGEILATEGRADFLSPEEKGGPDCAGSPRRAATRGGRLTQEARCVAEAPEGPSPGTGRASRGRNFACVRVARRFGVPRRGCSG